MRLAFGCWVLLVLFAACSPEAGPLERCYYHWETRLAPDTSALSRLNETERLYVKAFDVVWEEQPAPAAELSMAGQLQVPPLIPVIFITNQVIANTSEQDITDLARQLSARVQAIIPGNYPEIQVDCDWTASTRDKYFALLRAMRTENAGKAITCTVRLHQYRDRSAQGTPPVERATLMAYNTGDLEAWETENSIVDPSIIDAYTQGRPAYPVPLDIAVAVYDWAAVYRRGKLVHLINEPDLKQLSDTLLFSKLHGTRYRAQQSTYLNGIHVYEDDLIRHEVAPPHRADQLAGHIRKNIGAFPGQRQLIYRLNSRLWR